METGEITFPETDKIQRVLYILNFGRKLSENVVSEIQQSTNALVNEELIRVNINLSKNIYIQVVDVVNSITSDQLNGDKKIVVNLPGLPLAAVYILVELHARLGYFPLVLELYRDHKKDPIFSEFSLKKIVDLERERNVTRSRIFGQQL